MFTRSTIPNQILMALTRAMRRLQRRLPLELIVNILDCLGLEIDQTSLKACAHVCHSWLPLARSILWRDLKIDVYRGLQRVQQLADGSAVVCSYIRTLEFSSAIDEVHAYLVLKLIEKLPRLRTLKLWVRELTPKSGPSDVQPTLSVDNLTFVPCFSPAVDVTSFLAHFQCINNLHVKCMIFSDESSINNLSSLEHLRVTSLTVTSEEAPFIYKILEPTLHYITSLTLLYLMLRDWESTGLLIHCTAPHLKSLSLELPGCNSRIPHDLGEFHL